MSKVEHTAGPWKCEAVGYPAGKDISFEVLDTKRQVVAQTLMREIGEGWRNDIIAADEANAKLIAAAPTMADAIKGLIGLCQLLRNRDDIPSEVRQALTHNHRIIAGYEALTAAGIEGFQPTDFDLHKSGAA